jgi:cob(I)alamin adenosyltransferase
VVKLNRIYTRTGDDGTTGLIGNVRVTKDDTRVDAYGTVDETNAAIGVACVECARRGDDTARRIGEALRLIQHDLFDLGADLATILEPGETPGSKLRVLPAQTQRLEKTIDEFNERLAPLSSFVLPGGDALAAALHLARTICRRAERLTVTLSRQHPETTNPETVRYLNRLSDLLFVLGRVANKDGANDVLWTPGLNRGS